MLKKIDRYLLSTFFKALMVVILAIGMTIIIINMVEELRDFIDHEVPIATIIEYYFYFGGCDQCKKQRIVRYLGDKYH